MTPIFQVIADGADVAARIADRLVELSVSDVAGGQADTMSMVIDDRDGVVALPPHQSSLRVSLGTIDQGMVDMGTYLVDETEASGPVQRLRISATAADMSGPIRTPRTKAWEAATLGDMAKDIAGRAGLAPLIAGPLASIQLPYVAQTAESDMNLLTRLARQYHFTFAPKAGRLILAERGASTLPTGDPVPVVTLDVSGLSDWSFTLADRGTYKSAEASWAKLGSAQINKIVVGAGDPKRVIRHVFSSEDEARRAATASLQSAATGAVRGSVTLAGFGADLFAGGRLSLTGIRSELVGPYTITRAEHRLGTTLTTRLDLEATP